jgi:hypothetical protein
MMSVTFGIDVSASSGSAQKVTGRFESRPLKHPDQHWSMLLREISCNFVDRVLRIRSQAIHEITPSYMKEHE